MIEATHHGVIAKVEGNTAILRINSGSQACRGCSMSMLCDKPRTVSASIGDATDCHEGDSVIVSATPGSRAGAIILLLAAPLAILVGALWLCIAVGWSEPASALSALAACGLWYAALPATAKALGAQPKLKITQKID